jgi:hypothetical protein
LWKRCSARREWGLAGELSHESHRWSPDRFLARHRLNESNCPPGMMMANQ